METNNYEAKAKALLGHLSERQYSDCYVSLFKSECERLVSHFCSGGTCENYLDGYSERYGLKLHRQRRWVIGAVLSWFEDGLLPSRSHPLRRKATSYGMLSVAGRSHVDSYFASCGAGLSPSSRDSMSHTISTFLLYLEQHPGGLDDVTEESVWSYFYDYRRDALLHGYATCCVIRRFLRWICGQPGGDVYAHILPLVPMARRPKTAFDCLTAEEDGLLRSYILGCGCTLSLRDAAIVIVARFCGLRACDIASLRIGDIDLEHSRLKVRQRKTGVPLVQTLRPVVGNAIIRYVMQERPESDLPEVFLVDEREVRPLTPDAVGKVCDRAYRLAGIRQGHRCGSHLLRHRFAQSLIDSGACDAAAMRLLGHASPSSLDAYLETDEMRLRECALCISDFAIGKEVLA